MLILNDSSLLGDKRLNGEEEVIRISEDTDKRLEQYRMFDHEELKQVEQRRGQVMHHSDFIRKVISLNPSIFVEQQINFPDELGFYQCDSWGEDKRYLSHFPKGWIPEFSCIEVNERNEAIGKLMGWRNTILELLKKKAITWDGVKETFGDAINENTTRWRIETQPFRV